MTDEELTDYLRDNGYPESLAKQGRSGLVARWRQFVLQVADGFRGGLEEYRQGLDIRGLVTMAELDELVRSDDHRFAEHLVHRDQRVWESGVTTDPFWDYGYPANAGPQLVRELKEEGLA